MEIPAEIVESQNGHHEGQTTVLRIAPRAGEGPSLDAAIAAWLHSKKGLSESDMTVCAYRQIMSSFRGALHEHGLDLDSQVDAVAAVAQVWSRQRFDGRGESASSSTINQRLAALSSFYTFAKRRRLLAGDNPTRENPIALVERARVQGYAHAQALSREDLAAQLQAIDQRTVPGKRDYALLLVALGSGRRRSELAALTRGDLVILGDQTQGERVLVTWRRCKGGKVMHDELKAETAAALLRYLYAVHGSNLGILPAETPVWLSCSRANPGKGIGRQAIADIYAVRLGTSKVHVSRHTFARAMEDAGAKVSEIQARLGHASLATTGRYLAALTGGENPYAPILESLYGLTHRAG